MLKSVKFLLKEGFVDVQVVKHIGHTLLGFLVTLANIAGWLMIIMLIQV